MTLHGSTRLNSTPSQFHRFIPPPRSGNSLPTSWKFTHALWKFTPHPLAKLFNFIQLHRSHGLRGPMTLSNMIYLLIFFHILKKNRNLFLAFFFCLSKDASCWRDNSRVPGTLADLISRSRNHLHRDIAHITKGI